MSDPQIEVLQKMLKEKTQQTQSLERENQQLQLKVAGLEKKLADAVAEARTKAKASHLRKKPSREVIEVVDSDDETKEPLVPQPKVESGPLKKRPISVRELPTKSGGHVELVESGDEATVAPKLQERTVPELRTPARTARGPSSVPRADIPARPVDSEVPRDSMSPLSSLRSPDPSRNPSMDVDEVGQTVVKAEPSDQAHYFTALSSGNEPEMAASAASSSKKRRKGGRKTDDIIPKVEVKEEVVDAIFERDGSNTTSLGHLVMNDLGVIKSEEGEMAADFDVPDEYRKLLFTRTEISTALGGNPQATRHNWQAPNGKSRKRNTANNTDPFATFSGDYDTSLPPYPGARGYSIGCTLNDAHTKPAPVVIIVRRVAPYWEIMGEYDTQETARIPLEAIARFPADKLNTWADSICKHTWGEQLVARANKVLPPHQHVARVPASVRAAVLDGRIEFKFTVLKCVGFPTRWYDVLKQNRDAASESKPKVKDEEEAQTKTPRPSRASSAKGKKREAAGPLSGRQKRRRRNSHLDDDEDENESEQDDVEMNSDDDYSP
ncbi:hypothetical protein HMN09_00545000 [Mycena chlorophos]|uniref:DUF6697 domain-containing protein n=1 Tax=Mycena chlorophos TaxID=658473 RepID=A0A8H6T8L2_MYCCL|nr:hypothetical protein HMN09_00545000 [Mycena chlorophos]